MTIRFKEALNVRTDMDLEKFPIGSRFSVIPVKAGIQHLFPMIDPA
jgi:hypothetical protein